MRRSFLLKQVADFLVKSGYQSCFEITIFSPNSLSGKELTKSRLIYVVGLDENNRDGLKDLFSRNSIENLGIDFHSNIDSLLTSTRFLIEESRLEINWRGRIVRFNQDFDFQISSEDFEKKFLKSYIRFIVTRVDGDYFGKHDISPVLYAIGASTAGFNDFRGSLESYIKFVNRAFGEWNPIDPDMDYAKVYIADGAKARYRDVEVLGKKEISIAQLKIAIESSGLDFITNSIYDSIFREFGV